MTMPHETAMPTIVAPQVLLGNHLKALKLPTFAREYEKVAMEFGAGPRRLSALSFAPLRTRTHRPRAARRRTPYPPGAVPAGQKSRHFRLRRPALAQQTAGVGTGAL